MSVTALSTSPGIRIHAPADLPPVGPRPAARARITHIDEECVPLDMVVRKKAGQRPLRLVDDFGPVHTALDALPDPHDCARRLAVALYEASIGARPATQVMRWLTPAVYDSIIRRSGRAARTGRVTRRPIRLRRVRATLVPGNASVVEACAVLEDSRRVRVMAFRLEGLDGRWLVTACEIG